MGQDVGRTAGNTPVKVDSYPCMSVEMTYLERSGISAFRSVLWRTIVAFRDYLRENAWGCLLSGLSWEMIRDLSGAVVRFYFRSSISFVRRLRCGAGNKYGRK